MPTVEAKIAKLIKKYRTLTGKMLTIGAIESATGGGISNKITNVSGSSEYYKGSIISYNNEIKSRVVGVREKTLERAGAVSSNTALEMAEHGRQLLSVDICISDTGIAGPSGATLLKPVGLFFIAISSTDGTKLVKQHQFSGSRLQNKKNATIAALDMLHLHLVGKIQILFNTKFIEKKVVTSFIKANNKILILKRCNQVGTYPNKWSAISGYIDSEVTNQAYTEIKEETDMDWEDITLLKRGDKLTILDEGLKIKWIIYPFLFETNTPNKIKIDWENVEFKWIKPQDLMTFDTVPGLEDALAHVT